MTLYMIGLGLHDKRDISVKGVEAIRSCAHVYLEAYTSVLQESVEELSEYLGVSIVPADREMVEQRFEREILPLAAQEDIGLLIVGDPLAATTHMGIYKEARAQEVPVEVIHNASVLTAVGVLGLELYKYGKTTSIPFENEGVTTPVEVLRANQGVGLHTLFLLDLDPLEGRYLTASQACSYLVAQGVSEEETAIGCAALGGAEQQIRVGTLREMTDMQMNRNPQCLVLPGPLHFMEEEALQLHKREQSSPGE